MTRTRSASPSSSGRAARLSALRVAPDSLGFALDAAAQAVDAVRRGTALPAALAAVFAQMASGAQALARGATQDVAYR
ncbi:16S rRNA (cytosine(967)-C(5))-methyltransferase RsmB, partial [Burkholderia multivorans]